MRRIFAAWLGTAVFVGAVAARAECEFVERGRTLLLQADCETSSTIYVPDGFTLDGQGFVINAVDPVDGHFVGAVLQNEGDVAHFRDVVITASSLANVCDAALDGLRGILLLNASGSVAGTEIRDLNQGSSGCQEGNAIEVQNYGGEAVRVRIQDNVVSGYQKTGIAVLGTVLGTISNNVVLGFGPVSHIAQNGIQVGWGGDVRVLNNYVSENSYLGAGVAGAGVLVVGGPPCALAPCPYTGGVRVIGNVLVNNDVGVFLDNLGPDFLPPAEPTRNSVIANLISNEQLTNGARFQAGVVDFGTGDMIIANRISGSGYAAGANPGWTTVDIFAEPPFASGPVVIANRFVP
jgi:hypothetical protein